MPASSRHWNWSEQRASKSQTRPLPVRRALRPAPSPQPASARTMSTTLQRTTPTMPSPARASIRAPSAANAHVRMLRSSPATCRRAMRAREGRKRPPRCADQFDSAAAQPGQGPESLRARPRRTHGSQRSGHQRSTALDSGSSDTPSESAAAWRRARNEPLVRWIALITRGAGVFARLRSAAAAARPFEPVG